MKAIFVSFWQTCRDAWEDEMLISMIPVPLVLTFLIWFLVPEAEKWLCSYYSASSILIPYYPLFQLLILSITALIFSYVTVMIMLDELDNGSAKYLCVTPLAKRGYLIARLGIPNLISIIYAVALTIVFPTASMKVWLICLIAIGFAANGILTSLFVFAFSSNKVEGLALLKLSSLFLIGLPVPFFLFDSEQYIVSFLPAFWIAKFAIQPNIVLFGAFVATTALWYMALYKRFNNKII